MLDYVTYQNPEAEEKIDSAVVFLHGLGSNKEDLISLAPYFAKHCPHTIFISPDAPQPCDMAPFGFQWFSLQNRDPDVMLRGVEETAPVLNGFIDEILDKYKIAEERLCLLGFSQGCMMSLYVAPRRSKKIAGVLGYSGALIGASELQKEGIEKPPILLVHGTWDDVVPFSAMQNAADILTKSGFEVTPVVCEKLGHSINEKGLTAGIQFISEKLR